jgi:hypothetical protein
VFSIQTDFFLDYRTSFGTWNCHDDLNLIDTKKKKTELNPSPRDGKIDQSVPLTKKCVNFVFWHRGC